MRFEIFLGAANAYTGLASTKDVMAEQEAAFSSGIGYAEKAFALYPDNVDVQTALVDAYLALADLYKANEMYAEATTYYQKVLDLALDAFLAAKKDYAQKMLDEIEAATAVVETSVEEEEAEEAVEESTPSSVSISVTGIIVDTWDYFNPDSYLTAEERQGGSGFVEVGIVFSEPQQYGDFTVDKAAVGYSGSWEELKSLMNQPLEIRGTLFQKNEPDYYSSGSVNLTKRIYGNFFFTIDAINIDG